MWIALGIIGFIFFIVITFLLLPVKFIIKNDKENNFSFICKFFFFSFGDNKKENKTFGNFKKKVGADKKKKEGKSKTDILTLVKENLGLLKDVLVELVGLLKHCKGEKFQLEIVCYSDDAALAAIHYGECCAVVYPILGFINSLVKVKDRKRKIDIRCDYNCGKSSVSFEFCLSVKICYILVAAFKVVKLKLNKKK